MIVVSAGKIALEETAKKFADITATELPLGFGDSLCDYKSPLSQVKIFAEASSDKTEEALAKKSEAESMHFKTNGKKAKEKDAGYAMEEDDSSSASTTTDSETPVETPVTEELPEPQVEDPVDEQPSEDPKPDTEEETTQGSNDPNSNLDDESPQVVEVNDAESLSEVESGSIAQLPIGNFSDNPEDSFIVADNVVLSGANPDIPAEDRTEENSTVITSEVEVSGNDATKIMEHIILMNKALAKSSNIQENTLDNNKILELSGASE